MKRYLQSSPMEIRPWFYPISCFCQWSVKMGSSLKNFTWLKWKMDKKKKKEHRSKKIRLRWSAGKEQTWYTANFMVVRVPHYCPLFGGSMLSDQFCSFWPWEVVLSHSERSTELSFSEILLLCVALAAVPRLFWRADSSSLSTIEMEIFWPDSEQDISRRLFNLAGKDKARSWTRKKFRLDLKHTYTSFC